MSPCWEVLEKGEDEVGEEKDGGVEDETGKRNQLENGSGGCEEHGEVWFRHQLNSTRNKHLTINSFGFQAGHECRVVAINRIFATSLITFS